MKIYNNNDLFGMPGPFEAESFEALADEMTPTFEAWAEEEWGNDDDDERHMCDAVPPRVATMRAEFLKGLEEVK